MYADSESIHTRRCIDYFVSRGHEVGFHVPQPQLLHALSVTDYGYQAVKDSSAPVVLTAMGEDLLSDIRKDPSLLARVSDVLRQAVLVTADSLELCRIARKMGASRVELVRFGADFAIFSPSGDRKSFRESLAVAEDVKLVFSPRALTRLYRIDWIARAAALVTARFPQVEFVFNTYRCDPQYRAQIENILERHDVAARFVGPFSPEQMHYAYLASECVISVPSVDGFPVTIFEALACCRPVVLARLTAYEELLEHKHSAMFVDSEEELAQAVIALLEDQELARRLAALGQQIAFKYGNLHTEMEKFERLLLSLLQ